MVRPADGGAAAPEQPLRLTQVATRGRGRPRLWVDTDLRSPEPAPVAARPERRGITVPDSLLRKERTAAWDEIHRALDALEGDADRAARGLGIRSAS